MLQIKNKATSEVFTIHKYILGSDGIESVRCNDWYGHHRIGFDCEWATAEHDRVQVLVDALEWIKNYGNDLTVKFIDKLLEQWKPGKGKEPKEECTCSLTRIITHGKCYKCPELTNPQK